jgi:D-alanyl-D-alanine dipeptidase
MKNKVSNTATLQTIRVCDNGEKLIALPSVAGHPTGGAVDLTLAIDGCEIPMGGKRRCLSFQKSN